MAVFLRCLGQMAPSTTQALLPLAGSPRVLGGLTPMTPKTPMTPGTRSPSLFVDQRNRLAQSASPFGLLGRIEPESLGAAEHRRPCVGVGRPCGTQPAGHPTMLVRLSAGIGEGNMRQATLLRVDEDVAERPNAVRLRAAVLARRTRIEDREAQLSSEHVSMSDPLREPPFPVLLGRNPVSPAPVTSREEGMEREDSATSEEQRFAACAREAYLARKRASASRQVALST
mmetsp:Transcript_35565/g.102645  ORF Transcript_35565/g.102645 Transcript_35565/m.102645 type:complete len:229 (+) Transcript_35565:72-758(+)